MSTSTWYKLNLAITLCRGSVTVGLVVFLQETLFSELRMTQIATDITEVLEVNITFILNYCFLSVWPSKLFTELQLSNFVIIHCCCDSGRRMWWCWVFSLFFTIHATRDEMQFCSTAVLVLDWAILVLCLLKLCLLFFCHLCCLLLRSRSKHLDISHTLMEMDNNFSETIKIDIYWIIIENKLILNQITKLMRL